MLSMSMECDLSACRVADRIAQPWLRVLNLRPTHTQAGERKKPQVIQTWTGGPVGSDWQAGFVDTSMIDLLRIEGFDWDECNSRKSVQKHEVSQAEAEQVFFKSHC